MRTALPAWRGWRWLLDIVVSLVTIRIRPVSCDGPPNRDSHPGGRLIGMISEGDVIRPAKLGAGANAHDGSDCLGL
jgi:hypothetical protein